MTIIRQKCIEGFLDYVSAGHDIELMEWPPERVTDAKVQALITEYLEETYGYST